MGARRNRWLTDGKVGWIARPKDAVPDFGGSNVARTPAPLPRGSDLHPGYRGPPRSGEWELMPEYRTGEAAKRAAEMRE